MKEHSDINKISEPPWYLKSNLMHAFTWNVLMVAPINDCMKKNPKVSFIALSRPSLNEWTDSKNFYFEKGLHDNFIFLNLQSYNSSLINRFYPFNMFDVLLCKYISVLKMTCPKMEKLTFTQFSTRIYQNWSLAASDFFHMFTHQLSSIYYINIH